MLPTYEQAKATSRDGSPFSNGTEGYAWMANNCDVCINDKPARENDPGNGCVLILIALEGRTPAEWVDQWDGKGPYPLGDQYRCAYYRHEDDGGDPEPTPIPNPPGQLALCPREPYEQARMLAPVQTPAEVTA